MFGFDIIEYTLPNYKSFLRRQVSSGLVPRSPVGVGPFSELQNLPDKFQVNVDVSHFAPEEITVKTVDNAVVVSAKHEERADEHGYVSRQFSRRYLMPAEIDAATVTSTLSAEGILSINAPKKHPDPPPKENERVIPITAGGPSSPRPAQVDIPVQQAAPAPAAAPASAAPPAPAAPPAAAPAPVPQSAPAPAPEPAPPAEQPAEIAPPPEP